MGPLFVSPHLVNSISSANISLRFGHKSRYYFTMPRNCLAYFLPLGRSRLITASIFQFRFDSLSCNNVSQVFYFGYCALALINFAFDTRQLELLHKSLKLD